MSHIEHYLSGNAPIIAATDYVRAYPQLIAPYVGGSFLALGTDGFGRSDTRAALRKFFEVDRHHIAVAALSTLVREGTLDRDVMQSAIAGWRVDIASAAPWTL